jgi:hypothetical protein
MFITQRADVLPRTFLVCNTYMPSTDNADPYTSSVQWSRRFLGLRLFMSLAVAGWEGYGKHVDHSLTMIEILKQKVCDRGWRIANNSLLGVACLLPPECSVDVRTIVKRVVASGQAWVSVAAFAGREVVRVCVTSGETTVEDIAILVNVLNNAARVS